MAIIVALYRNYSDSDTTATSLIGSAVSTFPAIDDSRVGWTAPEGYTFKEWNSQRGGTGTAKSPGDTVDVSISDVWYAIWQAVQTDVEYIAMGSDLTSVANAIRTKGGTSGELSFPTEFVSAIQNISTGITPTGTKQIAISGAGTTTEDVTNYANVAVAVLSGTAGTPTATKGSVSNHSVSVTPSVTNSAGWVGSETKIGTPVSVTAAELVSGTLSITQNGTGIDVTNYAAVDVSVGGTPVIVDEKDVSLVDYDGTIISSYTTSEFLALTELPANPSHDGLTAQGWNWTLADAKAHVAVCGKLYIGQNYVTSDGKTRIYVHIADGLPSPYVGLCVNGTATIDWGDNTSVDTVSGSSLTTNIDTQHAYASGGDYVITITVVSGTVGFVGATGSRIFYEVGTSANARAVYGWSVKKIELGSNVLLGYQALYYLRGLESVSIPTTAIPVTTSTSYDNRYVFGACESLSFVAIPSGVDTIGEYMFSQAYKLKVSLPKSVNSSKLGNGIFSSSSETDVWVLPYTITALPASAFNGRQKKLYDELIIPDNITSIGNSVFSTNPSLVKVVIPSSVTSIGSSAFASCYGLSEIHFERDTPPTVANSNAFNNIHARCKIYVPTGSLSAYTSATNYPSSSTYTYVEE